MKTEQNQRRAGAASALSSKLYADNAAGRTASLKKAMCALLAALLLTGVLAGCQKTPESPIVVGKNADGWKEKEVPKAEEAVLFEAPARFEKQAEYNNTTYDISADISLPEQKTYPVYVVAPARFTQEQADSMMAVLLEGQELYEESFTRTKSDVQADIDYYTRQLTESQKDAVANKDIIASYQQYLSDLLKELETAPGSANNKKEPASKVFSCKSNQSLLSKYGEEIQHENGGISYEWTSESQRKAKADGNEVISGNVLLPSGRKMHLKIQNAKYGGNSVQFAVPDDSEISIVNADYSLDEAVEKGNKLISDMNIDAALVAKRENSFNGSEKYFTLTYRLNIPGTTPADVATIPVSGAPDRSFAPPLYQEEIVLQLDGNGIESFSWTNPVTVKSTDSENVKLMAWDDISEIIDQTLKVKTVWSASGQSENVLSRRVVIDRIILSYIQVRKGADLSERYYIPVWDVCGTIFEKYPTDIGDVGYQLDANGEADIFADFEIESPISILTINAIDGSVIDREQGC